MLISLMYSLCRDPDAEDEAPSRGMSRKSQQGPQGSATSNGGAGITFRVRGAGPPGQAPSTNQSQDGSVGWLNPSQIEEDEEERMKEELKKAKVRTLSSLPLSLLTNFLFPSSFSSFLCWVNRRSRNSERSSSNGLERKKNGNNKNSKLKKKNGKPCKKPVLSLPPSPEFLPSSSFLSHRARSGGQAEGIRTKAEAEALQLSGPSEEREGEDSRAHQPWH